MGFRCASTAQRLLRRPAAAPAVALRRAASTSAAATRRILVTGGTGQIGMELVPFLRAAFGADAVVNSDVRAPAGRAGDEGPFVYCDVQDREALARVVVEQRVDTVLHMASLLSAVGERDPARALAVNTRGAQNVLELARQHGLRVFAPSTIAVFGPSTPRDATPDETITHPTTIYGVTKVHLELLGQYYHDKFGVDFRSLRYPGVISSEALPGGGTTDYAVEIFYAALRTGRYTCFLAPDARLPMMYMPDCLKATAQLLAAPDDALSRRVYNVTAVSFTPAEVAAAIRKLLPGFEMQYAPDFRQQIADTWPRSLDDSLARRDWAWRHDFDLDAMAEHMLATLDARLRAQGETTLGDRLKLGRAAARAVA